MSDNNIDSYEDEASPSTEDIEVFDEDADEEDLPSVPNAIRITRNVLTKYERTCVIGQVANMINEGKTYDYDTKGEMEPTRIAAMLLKAGVLKLIIRRRFPNKTHEDWRLSELRILT
jgi:DNA-directed RNA polymerase subunit K/omega